MLSDIILYFLIGQREPYFWNRGLISLICILFGYAINMLRGSSSGVKHYCNAVDDNDDDYDDDVMLMMMMLMMMVMICNQYKLFIGIPQRS